MPFFADIARRYIGWTSFGVLCAVWLMLQGAHRVLHAGDGLSAQYFSNAGLTPPEAFHEVDLAPNANAMRRQWLTSVPDVFSVRWRGHLTISDPGIYEFALESDDASALFIDGRQVVDNGGQHSVASKVGAVRLERGAHGVVIEYAQYGGAMAFEWRWARAGSPPTAVPAWRLSQRPATPAMASTGRVLDVLSWIAGGLALVIGIVSAWGAVLAAVERRAVAGDSPPSWRLRAGCLVLFVGLAAVETWPLASAPAHLSRNDNGDAMLNEWTMAWVVHQAPRDIVHLFDANMFYPQHNVLAYSEALLVQSVFAAPAIWAGASPVLAYNLVLLAGLALSGWTMCLVVARWTRSWSAGVSSGIIFAFSAAMLTRLPHMQALHVEFIAPTLWALDRVMEEPRMRRGLSLAAWFVLQALTSYYLLVIMTFGLAAGALARMDAWRARGRRIAAVLAVSGGAALVLLGPFLWQYWRAHHEAGMTRPFTDQLPTFWQDYFTTPSHVGQAILAPLTSSAGLFPGFGGLLLAGLAIATGVLRQGRARMCAALGVAGVALSFGPDLPGYAWLHKVLLPLQGIRAPSRFGLLLTVAVAILAGYGLAELLRRIRSVRLAAGVAILIPVLLVGESLAAPIGLRRFDAIPAIYGRLKDVPNAVVVELPVQSGTATAYNAPYLLNSTASWYRLINGYSGFTPDSYFRQAGALVGFPGASTIDALSAMGVTHVFVHRNQLSAEENARLDASPLRLIANDGGIALYSVQPKVH